MWRQPDASELRERVRFERRADSSDGYGNTLGTWATVVTSRKARLLPTRGGEEVLASRLTGTGLWDLTVRRDTDTATVVVGDRIVDERDATRIWNIRWIADLEGRNRWLTMTAESGVADG